jgi:hypothetical protein
VTITATANELENGYEALRAQAVGEVPRITPRGLTLFLRSGLPAWMRAFPPSAPLLASAPAIMHVGAHGMAGVGAELVHVLAQMALSQQRRCCA